MSYTLCVAGLHLIPLGVYFFHICPVSGFPGCASVPPVGLISICVSSDYPPMIFAIRPPNARRRRHLVNLCSFAVDKHSFNSMMMVVHCRLNNVYISDSVRHTCMSHCTTVCFGCVNMPTTNARCCALQVLIPQCALLGNIGVMLFMISKC